MPILDFWTLDNKRENNQPFFWQKAVQYIIINLPVIGMHNLSPLIAQGTRPQSIYTPIQESAFITGNMQNVYWIMNKLSMSNLHHPVTIKVRSATPKSANSPAEHWRRSAWVGRGGMGEWGWQMWSIMREEAGSGITCQDTDACISLTLPLLMLLNPQL